MGFDCNGTREAEVEHEEMCPDCEGGGVVAVYHDCPQCSAGRVPDPDDPDYLVWCDSCSGRGGFFLEEKCPKCGGDGLITVKPAI
ncbi:MAG TPA: hypothetical protein PLR18_04510 [bacterium]|nr:hypothetical protein [bacterium]